MCILCSFLLGRGGGALHSSWVLSSPTGDRTVPSAVEAWSPNYWTTREFWQVLSVRCDVVRLRGRCLAVPIKLYPLPSFINFSAIPGSWSIPFLKRENILFIAIGWRWIEGSALTNSHSGDNWNREQGKGELNESPPISGSQPLLDAFPWGFQRSAKRVHLLLLVPLLLVLYLSSTVPLFFSLCPRCMK